MWELRFEGTQKEGCKRWVRPLLVMVLILQLKGFRFCFVEIKKNEAWSPKTWLCNILAVVFGQVKFRNISFKYANTVFQPDVDSGVTTKDELI